jgi:mercuric ion transport protein
MQYKMTNPNATGLSWLALFASAGTLLCCALPITLVSFGMGATVAALTSSFPILITLSQYKVWLFGISALLLTGSGWLLYRPGRACPTDADLAQLCYRIQRLNRHLFWNAVGIWCVGFFAAYLALPLRIWLGF